jgi:hypothetical protein
MMTPAGNQLDELLSAAEPLLKWIVWIAGGGDYPQDQWAVLYRPGECAAGPEDLSLGQLRTLAAAIRKAQGEAL